MTTHDSILILGGGAAGLAAAMAAANDPAAVQGGVTILEQNSRVGKKLLATGNGRCNLSNAGAAPERYHTRSPQALTAMLDTLRRVDVPGFWARAGLMLTQLEEGRIYPDCLQASAVLDVCRSVIEQAGIHTLCDSGAEKLTRTEEGFLVTLKDGRQRTARRVILACGGKAAPKLGAVGDGFELAKGLGHQILPLRPGLVPVRSSAPELKGLKGMRVRCGVTLCQGEIPLRQEHGEVQFTDYGLSGIVIMQMSTLMAMGKGRFSLLLDLFPAHTEAELTRFFAEKRARHGAQDASFLLTGVLKRQVGEAVLRTAHLTLTGKPLSAVTDGELSALTARLKSWVIPVNGLQSWEYAQVTCGGVSLEQVEPDSFQSKLVPGLYLTGELLDAAGDCGGFNLHWAVGTGIAAGEACAKSL